MAEPSVLDQAQSLEVVYYASPVPMRTASLTVLGLLFDRIHFPNVYLPTQGFNFDEVRAEHDRISSHGFYDYETVVLLRAMRLLPEANQLKEFCEFTGSGHLLGAQKDPRLAAIVDELDILIFGKKPEGFVPVHHLVSHKGLPGGAHHFEYPGVLYYPATALLYAHERGLPIVNDQPGLPVPSLGGPQSAQNNEKVLSTILAIECAALLLPHIQSLNTMQILEIREELKPYLTPFRLSLLMLAKDLDAAIADSATDVDVQEKAARLVRTSVVPRLAELRAAIDRPDQSWYKWAFGAAKYAPSLAAAYASVPLALAATSLTAICDALVNVANAQRKKQEQAKSGMYFLLKLMELGKEKHGTPK